MTKLKPKKISVTYIASSKQPKKSNNDDAAILQQLQTSSEDKDCPFC